MNILTKLSRNICCGVSTLLFPARPLVNKGFRGLVHMDPELCIGCAICRFRCTARAITFSAAKNDFTWSYDPAQCTFCGRCVEGCKDHALSQEAACPPIYLSAGALKTTFTILRKQRQAKREVAAPTHQEAPLAAEVNHDHD